MSNVMRRFLRVGLVVLVTAGMVVVPEAPASAYRPVEDPIANPDLDKSCGLNILLILDESRSIHSSGATDDVRDAFKAFTEALNNTSSSIAVAEFSSVARLPKIGAFTPGEYVTITDATKAQLDDYVDNGYDPNDLPNPEYYTNWEDALRMGIPNHAERPDPAVPHLTVLITDGEPNRIVRASVSAIDYANKVPLDINEIASTNADTAANHAVANANNLKTQLSHILAIAVGDGLSGGGSLNRLEKISGPDVFDGSGTFDISTDDIYREPDFDKLKDALRDAAFQLCAPSITVQKLIDLTPDPDSADDAVPGIAWEIAGTAGASGGYEWVLPSTGTGPSTKTTNTDGAGFATFQWNTNLPVDSTFGAVETIQPGFTNVQGFTNCTFRTPDTPDAPLSLDTVGDGSFSATIPQDAIVTCQLLNIADSAPAIEIVKRTDAQDANTAPGPSIPVGDPVAWTYEVTNTGNTTLLDIVVADSETIPGVAVGPSISCPSDQLGQGESMTCIATGTSGTLAGGGTFTGQYRNDASVDAVDTHGSAVSDTDPSHYFAAAPGIDVEKSTNTLDADERPGPLVAVGSTVDWKYVITNTGTDTLTGVTLDDDQLAPIDMTSCSWQSGTVGQLASGQTATCDISGTAIAGQYANIAEVQGTAPGSVVVEDHDPSHYFGVTTGVVIEKSTNGVDADAPTGPIVEVGSTVAWTYEVTNNGNTVLGSWAVTDDQGVAVACPRIPLLPGNTVTCSAFGTAEAGQYANVGTVTAPDPLGGAPLVDTDPSHYFGAVPSLTLEKATNTEDADLPTGPYIPVGAPVTWDYVVENTGNVPLTGLIVVDSDLGVITSSCDSVTLAVGAVANCDGTGSAVAGQYVNLALATALDPFLKPVGAVDPSHYFGVDSDIQIEKHTNGVDADVAPGVFIPVGETVQWDYIVTNTGNDTITSIGVTDDLEGSVACSFTSLDSGESGTCSLTDTAVRGQYANVATVDGLDQASQPVTDTDPSHYFGYLSAIDIEKSTNGQDADVALGVYLEVGDSVTWTYTVTNPGDVAIHNVVVVDDQGVIPVYQSGDTNGDDRLDADETWIYEASGVATAGQYTNTGTVNGVDALEDDVTDSDPSNYFGFTASISIEKTPDVEVVDFGEPHTFTIEVTNTGDSVLTDVEVTDPVTPACDRSLGDLQPGEVVTYTCDVASVTTVITNVAFVEGTAIDGSPRTDNDDATVSPIGVGGTGAIGDTVWADDNGNGIQDNGEKGIANAKVTVTFVSGPTSVFVTQASQVLTTDANGRYLAVGLVEGVWESELDITSVEGSLTTSGKYTIQLASGEQYLAADFGLEGALPVTGSDLDRYSHLGLLLLAIGGGLVAVTIVATRPRRQSEN